MPAIPLGPLDSARLLGLEPPRRAALLHSRALLGQLLGELFGSDAPGVDATACARCGGPHGRLSAPSAVVSVAYAGPLILAAVGRAAQVAAIGVDVEPRGASRERCEQLADLLDVAPTEAVRRWTQVEAVLKADGRGLRFDPERVRVVEEYAQLDAEETRYQLATVDGPASVIGTLAWLPGAR